MQAPGEQLLLRMWETVERAGGALFAPWQTRRVGKALNEVKRDEILAIAQAEKEVDMLRASDAKAVTLDPLQLSHVDAAATEAAARPVPAPLPRHVIDRVTAMSVADALRAEVNRAKSIGHAATWLESQAVDPPEDRPDPDWVSMWRDNAGKASAEQLQNLWGRVLAGEIVSPGRFSLRTLDFLRTLAKGEADDIARLAPFVVEQMIASGFGNVMRDRGITFELLVRMQALGILAGVGGFDMGKNFPVGDPPASEIVLRSTRKLFVVRPRSNTSWAHGVTVRGHRLTPLGEQLMALGDFQGDDEAAREYAVHLAGLGYDVSVCDVKVGPDGIAHGVNCVAVKTRISEILAPSGPSSTD